MIVSKDQTCGVPGRFIGENVALLRDIVDYTSFSNVPAAVLSLDQDKAFDRVDGSFICSLPCPRWASVHLFLTWSVCFIQVFRVVLMSMVICLLSLSFLVVFAKAVLCLPCCMCWFRKSLLLNIRANPRITGLSITGSQTPLSPISQYADDTSLIVNSDDAILAVFHTYSRFDSASGSKLNVSKSKDLWLGAWNNRRDPPVQLEWTSEKIKVLGVYVGPGDLEEANWRPRIAAVEIVLS